MATVPPDTTHVRTVEPPGLIVVDAAEKVEEVPADAAPFTGGARIARGTPPPPTLAGPLLPTIMRLPKMALISESHGDDALASKS